MSKTVLITGASGGIGLELARLYALEGARLVLVARSEGKLAEIKTELESKYREEVIVKAKDLSDAKQAESLYEELTASGIEVDVLVNNAGFGLRGKFVETELDEELEMIDLNVRTLTQLTKMFVRGMVRRGNGQILNVASTAAFQPGPLMAVYYATKAYVLSFTEALANELAGTGVTASTLCPGPTRTGFGDRADMGGTKLFEGRMMSAEDVAKAALEGMKRGKTVIIPGAMNRTLAGASKIMPRKLVLSITRSMQETKE